MTAKQLATMFLACKIPVADMEKMIEYYRSDELEKFRKYCNNNPYYCNEYLVHEVIESYLNQEP